MKTTVVGDYQDFAAASRVAAELMLAGFAQAEISIVGRDAARDEARFAYAGALAQGGGLVAIQSDDERAKRALGVMRRHGPAESYSAGVVPMTRGGRGRMHGTGLAHVAEPT